MSFKVTKREEKERRRIELRVVKMLMILDPRCGWGERSSEMFDFDPRAATCEQHDGTTNHCNAAWLDSSAHCRRRRWSFSLQATLRLNSCAYEASCIFMLTCPVAQIWTGFGFSH